MPKGYHDKNRLSKVRDIPRTLGLQTMGAALLALAESGFSQQQVADKFGVTRPTIDYHARKWGISFRGW